MVVGSLSAAELDTLVTPLFEVQTQQSLRETPDTSLIARAQRGDAHAVEKLYSCYVHQIYRYMIYRTCSTADAEELTAQVFIHITTRIGTYRDSKISFEAWLYQCAAAVVNVSGQQGKTRKAANRFEQLRGILHTMPDEQQIALILYYVERKSVNEIAEVISQNVPAVKTALHHGLSHIATALRLNALRH